MLGQLPPLLFFWVLLQIWSENVANELTPSPHSHRGSSPQDAVAVALGAPVVGHSALGVTGDSHAPIMGLSPICLGSQLRTPPLWWKVGRRGQSAAPSIVTAFPDIGAKLGCHSLIMLTIRLNHSGKSHKIPLSTLQWLFPIPIIQHLGRFGRRRKLVSLLLMLL